MATNTTFNLFMNNMNKLYKCALGLLTTFILSFASFSNADFVITPRADLTFRYIQSMSTATYTNENGIFCLYVDNSCRGNSCGTMKVDGVVYHIEGAWANNGVLGNEYCTDGTTIEISGLSAYYYYFLIGDGFLNTWKPDYTSLQCQTEYNLIPIEEVTANYCKLNFDLIEPQECPINSGTGAIIRSNLMINDIPYAQNQNINVFIPDFLAWNIAFNDFNTVIEVEGYNADEEYIENVINQEKLTPTNKDIEEMLTGFMTNYFPYLALAIVFIYLARKIFKIFK